MNRCYNSAVRGGLGKGSFAPRSQGSISTRLANRWAGACSGSGVIQARARAQDSGGLSARPRNPK